MTDDELQAIQDKIDELHLAPDSHCTWGPDGFNAMEHDDEPEEMDCS